MSSLWTCLRYEVPKDIRKNSIYLKRACAKGCAPLSVYIDDMPGVGYIGWDPFLNDYVTLKGKDVESIWMTLASHIDRCEEVVVHTNTLNGLNSTLGAFNSSHAHAKEWTRLRKLDLHFFSNFSEPLELLSDPRDFFNLSTPGTVFPNLQYLELEGVSFDLTRFPCTPNLKHLKCDTADLSFPCTRFFEGISHSLETLEIEDVLCPIESETIDPDIAVQPITLPNLTFLSLKFMPVDDAHSLLKKFDLPKLRKLEMKPYSMDEGDYDSLVRTLTHSSYQLKNLTELSLENPICKVKNMREWLVTMPKLKAIQVHWTAEYFLGDPKGRTEENSMVLAVERTIEKMVKEGRVKKGMEFMKSFEVERCLCEELKQFF
jgi:hypothetical protein